MSKDSINISTTTTTRTRSVDYSKLVIDGACPSGDNATMAFARLTVPVVVPNNRYTRMDMAEYLNTTEGQKAVTAYVLAVVKAHPEAVTAYVDLKGTDMAEKQYKAARAVAERIKAKGIKCATMQAFRAFAEGLTAWVKSVDK